MHFIQEFSLAGPSGDGRRPFINDDGVFIGDGIPLLDRDSDGHWAPRDPAKLQKLLRAGYGNQPFIGESLGKLGGVARALNRGDRCLAAITLLHARLPPLPDEMAARRLRKQANEAYLTEARVLSGPTAGEWVAGAGEVLSEAASAVAAIGVAGVAAIGAFVAAMVIPLQHNAVSSGDVPGQDGVTYKYDEGHLTLRAKDGSILFDGMSDIEGYYRDKNGTIIGRDQGNNFTLSADAFAAQAPSRANSDAKAESATIADSDKPKLCPDPGPDRPGQSSPRAAAYQQQVTGLPPGIAVTLGGVVFDGCRESDGTMLEAKGPGYAWAITNGEMRDDYNGKEKLEKQMKSQSDAAGPRMVEWHVAEPAVAAYLAKYARDKHFNNIRVIYTPARTP